MKDMLGRGHAVSIEEAFAILEKNLPKIHFPSRQVTLGEAYGRIVSDSISSPEDLPGFSRSAMDGFAVISSDTFGAGERSPVYLTVIHEVKMGDKPEFTIKPGEAARIATGGMIPNGADAVLMLECAQAIDEQMIEALKAVGPGENIIRKGEDVKKGEALFETGHRLRPQDVAVLAGVGLTEVSVHKRARVSIISTGDEIITPGEHLEPGLIRDTNSYLLEGLVMSEGAVPVRRGIVKDDFSLLRSTISQSVEESDLVLITGGSSVGSRDLTEKVISEMGAILFHSVAMKPGKPLLAGIIDKCPVFGLPGHPRAVSVCFDTLVRPVLKRMTGTTDEKFEKELFSVSARLSTSIRSAQGRQDYVSVKLHVREGQVWALPLLGKSGLISIMVRANGTLVIPAGKVGYEAGEVVQVRLLQSIAF